MNTLYYPFKGTTKFIKAKKNLVDDTGVTCFKAGECYPVSENTTTLKDGTRTINEQGQEHLLGNWFTKFTLHTIKD